MDKQIGKVMHYYDNIGVAVVEMQKPLKVGDTIKISGHENESTQTVASIQVEHGQVQKLGKGVSGALKVDKPVKEGDVIYLVAK
jgi:hypothetical protein